MRSCLVIVAALALGACGSGRDASECHIGRDGTVLAIGDSITHGYGGDGQGYAEQLQALLRASSAHSGVRVVNQGVDGEQSSGLLQRLDAALGAESPSVVIITTGGNDLLRKIDTAEIRSNLGAIVQHVRTARAYPIVFAVPRPSLAVAVGFGGDHVVFEELADAGGVKVIPEVVGEILAQEELRSDTIHPNARGYALMAQAAFDVLAECR